MAWLNAVILDFIYLFDHSGYFFSMLIGVDFSSRVTIDDATRIGVGASSDGSSD